MKKIHKLVSVLVCFVMALSCLGICVSAEFSDMAGKASVEVVERWQEAGLISGYPDGTFRPEVPVTRAQFAKIIAELYLKEQESGSGTFKDVAPDAWYAPYVEKASTYISCCAKDVSGSCENLFMPDASLEMQEAVAVLSRLDQVSEEVKAQAEGIATRENLILLIDGLLGGKEGFFYALSVIDAKWAKEDEILPLVAFTEEEELVTTNENGQVLLLSWHSYPESYIPGEQFTCKYGEMWTFTDQEALKWYDENHENVTDWELRFEQLLGLPYTDEKTHVSAFWVDPEEIIRPANQPDAKAQMDAALFDGSALGEHKAWFNGNAEYSYETSAYPWTRLGYTYDWLPDDNEYGMTEFIILPDSVIDVEWTKSFDEFIGWLAEH